MRKNFNTFLVFFFACFLILCSTGCGTKEISGNLESDKLKVIATIFPQYDFVRAVAGDKVELRMLLSPGVESHGFEPTLQDISDIEKSDLFIYVGGESDEWVNDVLSTVNSSSLKTISLIDAVSTLKEEEVEGMEEDENEHEEEENEVDEHVWTSPVNAIKIVNKICDTLCELDVENSEYYKSNASEYVKKLEKLDSDFLEVVENARVKTLVFAERFPFRYLTEQYGLKYYAAFKGCSSNSEPSLATINFLAQKVKDEKISKVLYTEFSNGNVADAICNMTGSTKAELHSCHNVSKEDFNNGVTYLELMERNVDVLREVLK